MDRVYKTAAEIAALCPEAAGYEECAIDQAETLHVLSGAWSTHISQKFGAEWRMALGVAPTPWVFFKGRAGVQADHYHFLRKVP